MITRTFQSRRRLSGFGEIPNVDLPPELSICPELQAQYDASKAASQRFELMLIFGGAGVSIAATLLSHRGYRTEATFLTIGATLVGAIYAGLRLAGDE